MKLVAPTAATLKSTFYPCPFRRMWKLITMTVSLIPKIKFSTPAGKDGDG